MNIAFLKRLYALIFGDAIHLGQYIRMLYFKREIKSLQFTTVLDAGCGRGLYTFYLAKRYPQARIDACDLNENLINSCKKLQQTSRRFSNIRFYTMDLCRLEVKEPYDFIYSIDVLEHIRDNKNVMKTIYCSLTNGGIFYVHMPGKVQKRIFPERCFRDFNLWVKREHIEEKYNLEELKQLMQEIGFKIIKSKY